MLLQAKRNAVVTATNIDTWKKISYNLGPELFHTLLTDDDTDFMDFLVENADKYGLTPANITDIGNANSSTVVEAAYQPTPEVISYSSNLMSISDTVRVEVKGSFMDYMDSYSFLGANGDGSVAFVSSTFSTLLLDVTTSAVIQDYVLTITDLAGTDYTHTISAQNINVYTPSDTGTGLELWTIGTGANNQVSVGNGVVTAQDTTGNGWNEHAYFGGVFNATSQLIVEFTVNRLNSASNAYGHIRFNNTNTASTAGNPRIYISLGSTTQIFNAVGGSVTTTSSVDDAYKVVFTSTTMETFKNGDSIQSHTGSYNINTLYFNFTAYRVLELTNIKIITD